MPSLSIRRRSRGITLVEICAVLAIVSVLAATAAPGMQSVLDARRLDGISGQLGADLQFIRTLAVARNQPLRLTLDPTTAGSCYLVHTGSASDCRCDDAGVGHCQGTAEALKTTLVPTADRVTLGATVKSLLFDPLHGTSSPAGTLKVFDVQGREIRHVVNVLGRVRTCSPDGRVAGHRPC